MLPGRSFEDFTTARQNVYGQVHEAASKIAPVEFGGRRLEVADVGYDPADADDEPNERFGYGAQATAVRDRRTLGRRLRGTVRLVDIQSGDVLEEQRKLLAVVPRLNEDGTFIYRGSRYNVVNQQRLKPAVFGRVKKNSELEIHANPQPGTGSMHRYVFNPESSVFYLNIRNSRVPLVGLLRTLGVDDDKIREAWGDEIAEKNFAKKDPGSLDKIYERLVPSKYREKDATKEYKQMAIRRAVGDVRFDPWAIKRLVGVESDRLTPEIVLKATQKALAMSRGEQEGDDRDHLAFQQVQSPEDLFAERIRMDSGFSQRNSFRQALRRASLKSLPNKLLQGQLESVIFGSGLGIQPESANPLDALDRASRVTKMGEGAIASSDAVPMESRDYHSSHQAYLDPARTTESLKVGVDLNFAASALKGKDGKIYTPLINARTGETEYLTPEQTADFNVAFQNRDTEVPGYVMVNAKGSEDYVKSDEVDYVMPDASRSMFSTLSNLVPLKGHQPQNRTAMGTRFLAQALPLVNREAPLVQVAVPGTDKMQSFEELYASKVGLIQSPAEGTVAEVTPGYVVLDTPEGKRKVEIHQNTPLGSKTSLRNTPIVKPGDRVANGQPLATSNYTNQQGTMALGLNARMALMPWGDNYEDAYTISESFAKRMASDHAYDYRREADTGHKTDLAGFITALPSLYSKSQLASMDDDGVVKVGTRVTKGDPLVLSAAKQSANLSKKLARSGVQAYRDASQTWDHEDDGVVSGVHRTKRGDVVVSVDSSSPLKDSDKLAELFGSKGIVRILPDDEMVQDSEGRPFDVVSSDLGLISRKNSSRAIAMMLGKVAQKTGQPYRIEEMSPDSDPWQLAKDELAKHGLEGRETVVDPVTGRKVPGVLTGPQYMLKLHHMAEGKAHGRGVGAYTSEGTPAKGSEEGMQAKRLSTQELAALVSHGAFEYLREASAIRGQRNDEYWARFINGHDLPEVKVPLVYEKFMGYLKGMGVNPVREGSRTKLMLLDDKSTDELAEGRQIKSTETVDMSKDMKPVAGGLFDPAIFGDGDKFAYYQLSEPIPHPLMEDPIRNLMGVTQKDFTAILGGEKPFGQHGTGPDAIASFLGGLNPERELQVARQQAQDSRKTKREAAVKRLRYLRGIVDRGVDPKSLMLTKVPVIPPVFRPVSKLEGKDTPLIDGMNLLYREMQNADDNFRKVKKFAGEAGTERLAVYESVRAAMGLRQPLDPELAQKNVTGIMARLVGPGSPKNSYAQRKLLSGTVDSVGRGVAAPNAKLRLDEVGIPEEQAWKIFQQPILRNLRRRGVSLQQAREAVEKRTPEARRALDDELSHRPVTVSRAPVLHKYGMLAFMPKLVPGTAVHFNPLVHAGYNLDHDGDTVNFHAMIGEEAIAEAKKKLLPSRSLLSPKDFKTPMFVPRQDHALGIYLASSARQEGKSPVVFASRADAVRAYKRGEINADTPIKLLNKD